MDKDMIIIQNDMQQGIIPLNFFDILLDETLIIGTIYIPLQCLQKTGTLNSRLPAKQIYEYMLRLALEFPICLTDTKPKNPESYKILRSSGLNAGYKGLQADCYIAARYKRQLLGRQLFDSVVNSILTQATQEGCQEQTIPFLEMMLQERAQYQYFYQGSQPFLIYTGDTICYNILSVFAESLGSALREQGYLVEYFDFSKENFTAASRYIGQSFQAVIGLQSYMFSTRLTSGNLLHNEIKGPKYNFIFDHPVWHKHWMAETPDNFTVFTLDRNYAAYIQQYYPVKARFLPPGGIPKPLSGKQRIYDVTFMGSYINNAQEVSIELKQLSRPMRFLVNRFWLILRKHPDCPAEKALLLALNHYHRHLEGGEFTELFHSMRKFVLYISYHFRYKLIKILVESGITIHVFGNTWAYCPLLGNKDLIWHEPDLTTDECLDIWQQSKIALNIMSWHKDAMTERIANCLLQKAAVLTEQNPYLEEQFENGKEIVFYKLAKIQELPSRIRSLLSSPGQIEAIGEAGYQKAIQSQTWDCRARELLEIARQDSAQMYALTDMPKETGH